MWFLLVFLSIICLTSAEVPNSIEHVGIPVHGVPVGYAAPHGVMSPGQFALAPVNVLAPEHYNYDLGHGYGQGHTPALHLGHGPPYAEQPGGVYKQEAPIVGQYGHHHPNEVYGHQGPVLYGHSGHGGGYGHGGQLHGHHVQLAHGHHGHIGNHGHAHGHEHDYVTVYPGGGYIRKQPIYSNAWKPVKSVEIGPTGGYGHNVAYGNVGHGGGYGHGGYAGAYGHPQHGHIAHHGGYGHGGHVHKEKVVQKSEFTIEPSISYGFSYTLVPVNEYDQKHKVGHGPHGHGYGHGHGHDHGHSLAHGHNVPGHGYAAVGAYGHGGHSHGVHSHGGQGGYH